MRQLVPSRPYISVIDPPTVEDVASPRASLYVPRLGRVSRISEVTETERLLAQADRRSVLLEVGESADKAADVLREHVSTSVLTATTPLARWLSNCRMV